MLPVVTDDQLRKELGVLVTSGWRLPERPQRSAEIPHLLYLARDKAADSFYEVARRLQGMLERSLLSNVEALEDEPLLSEQESRGLRILFGTHPTYQERDAMFRRVNAAEYLDDERTKTILKGDTVYRKQAPWLQKTIECLRSSYGQEVSRSALEYESIRRASFATVGSHHRIAEVQMYNLARSRVNGLEFVRMFVHVSENEFIEDVFFEPLGGPQALEVKQIKQGSYRITLCLGRSLSIGEDLSWGLLRQYCYKAHAPKKREDHLSLITKNGGFDGEVRIKFDCDPPTKVWHYDRTVLQLTGPASEGDYLPLEDSIAIKHFDAMHTQARRAYGIAWQWA